MRIDPSTKLPCKRGLLESAIIGAYTKFRLRNACDPQGDHWGQFGRGLVSALAFSSELPSLHEVRAKCDSRNSNLLGITLAITQISSGWWLNSVVNSK